jgi:hypothetical protein
MAVQRVPERAIPVPTTISPEAPDSDYLANTAKKSLEHGCR